MDIKRIFSFLDHRDTPPGEVEKARHIAREVKRRATRPCIALQPATGRVPHIADTKLGGLPYYDGSQPYPTDAQGNSMMLVAQINLSQLPASDALPAAGLLQFFITAGEEVNHGCNRKQCDAQDNFRVVYYPQIATHVTPQTVAAMGVPTCENTPHAPVMREVALDAVADNSAPMMNINGFNDIFAAVVKELYHDTPDVPDYYFKDFAALNAFGNAMTPTRRAGMQLLGYPSFTQDDPRYDEAYRRYDTLLLSIPSIPAGDGNYLTLWGDCGIANLMIAANDLRRGDFARVMYTWDCC